MNLRDNLLNMTNKLTTAKTKTFRVIGSSLLFLFRSGLTEKAIADAHIFL